MHRKTQLSLPITCRVVKLKLLKSLRYFVHHHNSIALWNRNYSEKLLRVKEGTRSRQLPLL